MFNINHLPVHVCCVFHNLDVVVLIGYFNDTKLNNTCENTTQFNDQENIPSSFVKLTSHKIKRNKLYINKKLVSLNDFSLANFYKYPAMETN